MEALFFWKNMKKIKKMLDKLYFREYNVVWLAAANRNFKEKCHDFA